MAALAGIGGLAVLLLQTNVLQLVIFFTECNSGTTQKLPFGVSTSTEIKNVTATCDSKGI